MVCPKCGNKQPDRTHECQKCGIIFAKFDPSRSMSQARRPQPASSSSFGPRPSVSSGGGGGGIFSFKLIFILVIAAFAMWSYNATRGLPIPPGAYQNDEHSFAVSVPEGWMTISAGDLRVMMVNQGGMPGGLTLKDLVIGFRPDLPPEQPAPFVYIAAMKGSLPEWTPSALEKAANDFEKGAGPWLKEHSQEVVKVDNLTALKIFSKLKIKGPNMAITVEGLQGVIPGWNKAYFITAVWPMRRFPNAGTTVDEMIDSFRVLKRPYLPRYYGELP